MSPLLVFLLPILTDALKPNILLFVGDDVGWNNVGWHSLDAMTPTMDRDVIEGIELDRMYAFVYCSPSRASIMTGRLPFHSNQLNYPNWDVNQGAPLDYTFLPQRLQTSGYTTVHSGKWHLGMASWENLPIQRGFDRSFGFFEGAHDHLTQRSCADYACMIPINATYPVEDSPFDLWLDDGPAYDHIAQERFSDSMFTEFAVDTILAHNFSTPLFLYMAPGLSHTPLEIPPSYLAHLPPTWEQDRRTYTAMMIFMDEMYANVTDALKSKHVWNNTLVIFTSDNGGPIYSSFDDRFQGHGGANNFPLRGGKCSVSEGGVRVPAFLSGGFLPVHRRGLRLDGHMHVTDLLATIADVVGFDPADPHSKSPRPIDSLSMWPYLRGVTSVSPRTEIPLAIDFTFNSLPHLDLGGITQDAIIVGDFKLMRGTILQSFVTGPQYPNASSIDVGAIDDRDTMMLCRGYSCLYVPPSSPFPSQTHPLTDTLRFNITADPFETHDLAKEMPQTLDALKERIDLLKASKFQMPSDERKRQYTLWVERWQNVVGPFLNDQSVFK